MKKINISFIVLIAMLTISGVFSFNLFMRQRAQKDLLDIHKFPLQFGEWKGKDFQITDMEYRILETRNLISREYVNPAGEKIYLFIVYSETNRSVFHPPEVCLVGSGVEIVDKRPEEVRLGSRSFSANKLFVGKGKANLLVLYCFKAANLYTDSYPLQQAYFAMHQLFGRRTQGATIRVSMPLVKDEQATLSKAKDFLVQIIKTVESLK